MSAKRRATNYLTDRNWDVEEEPEEPGLFREANEDVIKNRVIKKAKHRLPENTTQVSNPMKSAFSGFTGFKNLSPIEKITEPLSNTSSTSNTLSSLPTAQGFTFLNDKSDKSCSGETKLQKTDFKFTASNSKFDFKSLPQLGSALFHKGDHGFNEDKSEKSKAPITFCPLSASAVIPNPSIMVQDSSSGCTESSMASKIPVNDHNVANELNKNNNTFRRSEANKESNPNEDYLQHVECLNISFMEWISKHVRDDPYCILTSTFRDYENHLKNINETFPEPLDPIVVPASNTTSANVPSSPKLSITAAGQTFRELSQSVTANREAVSSPNLTVTSVTTAPLQTTTLSCTPPSSSGATISFSVVEPNITDVPVPANSVVSSSGPSFPTLNFGLTDVTSTIPSTSGFTFGNNSGMTSGFSFAMSKPQTTTDSSGAVNPSANEEEYVPPKPEVVEITEEGSLFSLRCKLFHKIGEKWNDGVVGNVHVKKIDDECQILMRANNNLGTILLNIIATSVMPISRLGKNNLSLLCVPNPPVDPNKASNVPVPLLIRAKTSQEADELLAKINEVRGT